MSRLNVLMGALLQESKHRVDLRCSLKGGIAQWVVMADWGNIMMVVPGTFSGTPEGAVKAALQRWRERSPEKRFLHTADGSVDGISGAHRSSILSERESTEIRVILESMISRDSSIVYFGELIDTCEKAFHEILAVLHMAEEQCPDCIPNPEGGYMSP